MRRRSLLLLLMACVPLSGALAAAECGDATDALSEARCWLDHGRYAAALLAAERHLAVHPGDTEASALKEAALRRVGHAPVAAAAGSPAARGWVALQAGYDTNANVGTDTAEVRIPLRRRLGPIETGDVQRRASTLLGLNGAFEASLPVSARNRLRLLGVAGARVNPKAYVPRHYALETHAEHRGERLRAGVWLGVEGRWLNRYRLLDAESAGARLGVPMGREHELEVFHAYTEKTLPEFEIGTRERAFGASWHRRGAQQRITLIKGSERAPDSPSFLDRDFAGGSVEAWTRAGPGRFYLGVHYLRSRYTLYSQPFLGFRLDEFTELHTLYEYRLAPAWYFVPRLVLQHNRSNVIVTAYERAQWLLELRREF